jgi:hypothetical protein
MKKAAPALSRDRERLEGRIMTFSGCDGRPKKNARY